MRKGVFMRKTQHYQTSFSIRPIGKHTVGSLYSKIQNTLWQWIAGKEDGDIIYLKKDFCYKLNKTPLSSSSTLETATCIIPDRQAWCMEYREFDTQVKGRTWITEIGVREDKKGNRVIFSIVVSYVIAADALLRELPKAPDSTIPRCVKMVLDLSDTYSFFGNENMPVKTNIENVIQTKSDVDKVLKELKNPNRTISIILLGGDSRDAKSEARILHKALLAKALVYVLAYAPCVRNTLKEFIPDFNKCRVFLPPRFNAHPSYPIEDAVAFNEIKKRILESQHGGYATVEDGAVTKIQEIHTLIRMSKFEEFRQKFEASNKDNKEAKDFLGLYEEENVDLRKKIEELEGKYKTLEDDNINKDIALEELKREHKREMYDQEQKYRGQLQASQPSMYIPCALPKKLSDLLPWIENFLPNIVLSENAYKTAKNYVKCECLDEAWEIFRYMNKTLYSLKFENNEQDIEGKFLDETGYQYAKTEGSQTKSDSKLADKRKFLHNGKNYEMWSHIKYGTREPDLIRVHFAFDDDTRKIVVGHFGAHMDNATTKKMS